MAKQLFKNLKSFVIDYQYLMEQFKDYASPRSKISRMLKEGSLIRVKKGLYVLGKEYRTGLVDRSVLANLIYGPSYVSGLYALSYYGMIPERVETVTSMSVKKSRSFSSPFGLFEYNFIREERFKVGITIKLTSNGYKALFATPEKALADLVAQERDLLSLKKLKEFLFENLRVDHEAFEGLDYAILSEIAEAYKSPSVKILLKLLKGMK
ncbi:MAG: hypothetical protein L7U87_00025 [Chlamydiales bacterium]|nr:hypothetical protein [Chlamydiales bacterium]